eukprot:gb/GFBE01039371.1/.p1 GENE.gb/GFBE01039371.1/~~gb/GFBE01039371.1/.p1  ORF type:complete len:225 (+),score=37.99 gb/GFBE01039371.1/:1-675(+)
MGCGASSSTSLSLPGLSNRRVLQVDERNLSMVCKCMLLNAEHSAILKARDDAVPVSGNAVSRKHTPSDSKFDAALRPNAILKDEPEAHRGTPVINAYPQGSTYDRITANGMWCVIELPEREPRETYPDAELPQLVQKEKVAEFNVAKDVEEPETLQPAFAFQSFRETGGNQSPQHQMPPDRLTHDKSVQRFAKVMGKLERSPHTLAKEVKQRRRSNYGRDSRVE